jgi:hypothetical protein
MSVTGEQTKYTGYKIQGLHEDEGDEELSDTC